MVVVDTVLAHGAVEFVHAHVLFRHVGEDHLTVVNEQAGLTFHELSKPSIGSGEFGNQVIHEQQSYGRDHAAGERSVRARHGVLNGIGNQKQQGEIEGRHLADLPLAADPHAYKDDEVDDNGANENRG